MAFEADAPIFAQSGDLPPELLAMVRRMIGQLPIVWALRSGGLLRVPVAEVDATGGYVLGMETDFSDPANPVFVFKVSQKS